MKKEDVVIILGNWNSADVYPNFRYVEELWDSLVEKHNNSSSANSLWYSGNIFNVLY